MKKSIMAFTVAASVGVGSFFSVFTPNEALAVSKLEDLNNKKSEIENKQSSINSEMNKKQSEMTENQQEQDKVASEIERLDFAIGDTESKINKKTKEIEVTKQEVEKLKGEIEIIIDRINKRNELLKDRARSFQESGGMISYVDVLMGSQSFSDFIDRMGAVVTIVEADQGILKEHQEDKKLLEQKRAEVETKLANLKEMLNDLETMKKSLNSQKAEKDKLMKSLKKEEEELEEATLALEEEQELLAAQKSAIQRAMQLEKQRQDELARQSKESQQNKTQKSSSSSSNNSSTNSSRPTVSAPPVSSGAFTRPAAGRLTSGFGARWGELHAGVDIAASGTVPIVAAADGVVIRSYYSSSYGNAIFISHSINGQIYTTVYAHMSSRTVGAGATVSKGQMIGYMGNTGQSYGQHLHFELHKGPWNAAKSNAINPIGIVPF